MIVKTTAAQRTRQLRTLHLMCRRISSAHSPFVAKDEAALCVWVGVRGINSCSLQALEHRLSSCGPGPSCSMAHGILLDQGSVSCIGRQILYHESSGKTFFSFLTFSLTPPFSGPSSKHYMDNQIVHMAFLASVSVPLLE